MSAPREAAARRPLVDDVAERIQRKILAGPLHAGDRLPGERALAVELGVNRGSVREALKKLEQLRLIEIQRGSGIRVRKLEEASLDLVRNILVSDGKPDRAWLADLLDLREALLPGLVRLSVERSSLEEREACARLLRRAADPELDLALLISLLGEIQRRLARMSRNQILSMLAHWVGQFLSEPIAGVFLEAVVRARRRLVPLFQRLALALEARDVDTAERALRELLRRHSEAVLAAVDAS